MKIQFRITFIKLNLGGMRRFSCNLKAIKQIAGVNAIERIHSRDGKRQVQDVPSSKIAFMQAFATKTTIYAKICYTLLLIGHK
jgi:hypothetical protein